MRFSEYNQDATGFLSSDGLPKIASFIGLTKGNIDLETVESFGEEWLKFNSFSEDDIMTAGDQYFDIVDESIMGKEAIVLDAGCGSGRWTKYMAPRVKIIEAIDPSKSVLTAQRINGPETNVRITQAEISNIPFRDNTFDFAICLGVLHHIPDTQKALNDIVKKIKKGGSLLMYIYYDLDNRGFLYKWIFKLSNILRLIISRLPKTLKKIVCDIIAISIYLPFILLTKTLLLLAGNKKWIRKIPLSYYSDKSLNIIRNDALDRFGTPLEQRFTKAEIRAMMYAAGLDSIVFSNNEPFWHSVGTKK